MKKLLKMNQNQYNHSSDEIKVKFKKNKIEFFEI